MGLNGHPAGWYFSLYPDAAEGGGCFQGSIKNPNSNTFAKNPDSLRAKSEAARRAKGNLRRYCVANELTRLVTLTYAGEGQFDQKAFREDIAQFVRNLKGGLGGDAIPYLWVPEWHKSHGLHAHLGVAQYIPRNLIESAWGKGFVHIKLLDGVPFGSGERECARRAAGYLGKYASKSFADDRRIQGLHRYEIAQGFKPLKEIVYGKNKSELWTELTERMHASPIIVWDSIDAENWQAPPSIWMQWR